jgi:F-type H+/Na+-transporting ATPase subunit alpha
MKFRVDEIASILREEIAGFETQTDVASTGRVVEVGDGIVQIVGLDGAMAGELLRFESGAAGQVFNLQDSSIGAVLYGGADAVKSGDSVTGTGTLLSVPVGDAMLGRVISALGEPIDGKGAVETSESRPVEHMAPGIAARQPITQPLATGIRAIDSMTPIGRGQRQLIIGDRKTGKTAIALDAIINQKDTGVICIYVAIGQKESSVATVVENLAEHGAMDHTIVVSAASCTPAPLQYIAPYTGCALAEHFMDAGRDVLVIYDDLTKHAAAYREISLLLRRPPGREAYPGDVFYLHSRLLERACKLSADLGGGSMTALPICQTQEGEVSAYIPTNLISITDGQIYLEPELFFAGVRPAMNVGISVSRVGYKASTPAMKDVAKSLRLDLAAFRELEAFAQLGMELEPAAQKSLDRGNRLVRILTQGQYVPQPVVEQVISLYAGTQGHLDAVAVEDLKQFEVDLIEMMHSDYPDFFETFAESGELTSALQRRLRFALQECVDRYMTKGTKSS